ncbi:MAG: hypothetical protein AAFQ94_06320 [Bacteroidota bacterium]
MKLLATFFILFPGLIIGQDLATAFPEFLPVTNDVIEIRQRSFKRGFLPSGWKSTYHFKDGRLMRQTNYFRAELRMDEVYEYKASPGSLIVRNIYTDKKNYSLTIHHFDGPGKLIKSELFFDQDTINPQWIDDHFEYDSLTETVRFKRTNYYPNNRQFTKCIEMKLSNGRLMEQLMLDSCNEVTQREYIEYLSDRKVFNVIDYMNSEVVVTGGRSEQGVQRYLYKLDKKGNWTKRYYVRANGRKILDIKRKIRYASK